MANTAGMRGGSAGTAGTERALRGVVAALALVLLGQIRRRTS